MTPVSRQSARTGTTADDDRPESRARSTRLTWAEIIRRRNEDWRIDHDEGRYDPALGRPVKRTLELIARIYQVDVATVFRGIQAARRVRAEVSDADATHTD